MRNETTKLYRVAYQVRQQGAIGKWERRTIKVRTDGPEAATAEAMLQLRDYGWDVGSPLSVAEVNS